MESRKMLTTQARGRNGGRNGVREKWGRNGVRNHFSQRGRNGVRNHFSQKRKKILLDLF
jgi:hypothetical protein